MDLKSVQCQPCRSDAVALDSTECDAYLKQLPGWQITSKDGVAMLEKTFEFTNYTQCLVFVHEVGSMAEKNDHHPEMTISWGKVKVCWWTHTLGGLHLNDFILAARCDEVAEVFYVN